MKNPAPPTNIDEYIASFPDEVQILRKIRVTIRKAAPDAEETISYQIPTFTLHGETIAWSISRVARNQFAPYSLLAGAVDQAQIRNATVLDAALRPYSTKTA